MDVLVKRDQVVRDLAQAVARGGTSLENVPGLLRRVLTEGMWKERQSATGEVWRFERWIDFVQGGPPEGLGTTSRRLEHLCQDDREILSLLDGAAKEVQPNGGDRKSETFKSDVTKKEISLDIIQTDPPTGTSRAAALRRLRKPVENGGRPDLHAAVLAGEKTPHAAMIEAGFRTRTITVPLDPRRAAAALVRHFPPGDLAVLVKELTDR